MTITCFIRYRIDPFQRAEFEAYARRWLTVIPACGGDLVGYFLPHEGYRARLKADPAARENFAFAQQKRFILSEERTFTERVSPQ
jgi:hypothetical protein